MNILLMGLPGAGKGTQSERITQDYPVIHIATGDIFRQAIREETPLGLEAKSYTDHGNLVPDEITNSLVKERLNQADVKENGFMLDGYPRTIQQAKALDQNLQTLKERLSGRIISVATGESYHKIYNPPKVEDASEMDDPAKFYQREDDKPEKVAHRIQLQMESIQPILDYYEERGLLTRVSGEGSIDDVYDNVKKALTK